jgi:hypothetical protein
MILPFLSGSLHRGVANTVASAWIGLCTALFLAQHLAAVDFPMAENYAPHETERFVLDAEEFLRTNPESPHAARVAFDLFAISKLRDGDDSRTLQMTHKLLLDFADTLHGRYYLSTLADAKSAGSALRDVIRWHVQAPAPDFAPRYARIFDRLARRWGADLFKDGNLAMQSLLILEDPEFAEVYSQTLEVFKTQIASRELEPKLVEAVTQSGVPLTARIKTLHTLAMDEKSKADTILRDLLLLRLPPKLERVDGIPFLRAEVLLQRCEAAAAYSAYRGAPQNEFSDRDLWLKGWCAARVGDKREADRMLQTLRTRFPKSPYTPVAAEVLENAFPENPVIAEYTRALDQIVELCAHQTDSFNLKIEHKNTDPHKARTAFVNYSGPRQQFSVMLCNSNREVLAAFESNAKRARAWGPGRNSIHVDPKGGVVHVPEVTLTLEPGNNSFQFRTHMAPFGKPIPCPLLHMSAFADSGSRAATVAYFQAYGMCFGPIRETDSGKTLQCMLPSLAGPDVASWRVRVSKDGRLVGIEGGEHIWEIRSGISVDEPFDAPGWPDLPETIEEDNFAVTLDVLLRIVRDML